MKSYQNKSIKEWAVEDRPREKLLHRGIGSITDAELIAILLATGTKEDSALDLGRKMIDQFGGISQLAKAGVDELVQIKGIGKVKAISIVCAFELGRRRASEKNQLFRITNSKLVAEYLKPRFIDLEREEFLILYLNRNNEIRGEEVLSTGGISSTIIDPRLVFKKAVNQLACSVVLAHNHPSGNLRPSDADIRITHKLRDAGNLLDIKVLDHLIISEKGYYSFADEGML